MAPPPAVAASAGAAAPTAAAPVLHPDPKVSLILEPLLVHRDELLRSQRKATCWLFFREVAVRPSAVNDRVFDTCLACRICRPDIVSLDRWDAAKGNRSGLVCYSSSKGTAAMRHHVKNAHLKESMAIDRALSLTPSFPGMSRAEGAAERPAVSATSQLNDLGKRRLDTGNSSTDLDGEAKKRAREGAKAGIVKVVQDMEVAIASLQASLDGVKRQLQDL